MSKVFEDIDIDASTGGDCGKCQDLNVEICLACDLCLDCCEGHEDEDED